MSSLNGLKFGNELDFSPGVSVRMIFESFCACKNRSASIHSLEFPISLKNQYDSHSSSLT